MNSALKAKTERYTVADYMSWDDGERWELIEGVAYNMSPAPATRHQDIALNLGSLLHNKLRGKPCRPFIAATDVVLSGQDVVQPDIFIVCDPTKITPKTSKAHRILSPKFSRLPLPAKTCARKKPCMNAQAWLNI